MGCSLSSCLSNVAELETEIHASVGRSKELGDGSDGSKAGGPAGSRGSKYQGGQPGSVRSVEERKP